MSPQAESAVEAAIYSLAGTLFTKIINPLVILFVALAIGLFLYIIFRSIYKKQAGYGKDTYVRNLLIPIIGLTIMLSAIGITYFIGNTANEVFQGGVGGKGVQGIDQVARPIQIR